MDVRCIQDMSIQGSSSIDRQTCPSSPSVKFHLRRPRNTEATALGFLGVVMILIKKIGMNRLIGSQSITTYL